MAIRDTRRSKESYDAMCNELVEELDAFFSPERTTKREAVALKRPAAKCEHFSRMGQYVLNNLRVTYARGDGKELMRVQFEEGLRLLWQGEECFRNVPHASRPYNQRFVLSILVLAIGLGYDSEVLKRFVACTSLGEDQLSDRVLAVYAPGRPVHNKLRDPSKYRQLYKVLDAPESKRPGLIKKYLDSWPKRLGEFGPEGIDPFHLREDYDGYYWCYEAAAVVLAFEIDDSSFINHEYYPTELMHWCREDDRAEHTLPLEDMTLPEYGKTLSTGEIQAQNLANLTEIPLKKGLQALQHYKPLFDSLCEHLPKPLQQKLWNLLVDEIWEEYEACGFIDALGTAIDESNLFEDYGFLCLMHVDCKDRESAESFSHVLVKEHGLADQIDFDQIDLSNIKYEIIPALFAYLDRWLQPQQYRFLQIGTGGDSYMGVIVRKDVAGSLVANYHEIKFNLPE